MDLYLITKIDDDVIIGELTGYSMYAGAAGTEDNIEIIREIRFSYEDKKVKEWVNKTDTTTFITVSGQNNTNIFSQCKREINEEGYSTYSYKTLWPVYNKDLKDLIIQFKRDQKIEDILHEND
jgi:hypothetical protein